MKTEQHFQEQQHVLQAGDIIGQLQFCGHFLHYKMGCRTGQRRILTVLLERRELLQRELQEILQVKSGTLSEIVIKMERDHLVEKVRSQKDGRHLVLRLTERGVVEAEKVKAEYDRRIEEMMSCFSPEEMKALYEMLSVMMDQWKEAEKGWCMVEEQKCGIAWKEEKPIK